MARPGRASYEAHGPGSGADLVAFGNAPGQAADGRWLPALPGAWTALRAGAAARSRRTSCRLSFMPRPRATEIWGLPPASG